ncbi:SAM-dependent methyltransferase [Nocardioides convexus]|uniref:SAM-dependent methyltransferase n=1 Tax=Nocardioides convexus TaxID=2712224 RepID=UPI0024183124|nr:SAM-dependent methyltransferase [Nocardioides convexus]
MTRATTANPAAPSPAPQAKPGAVAFVGTGPGDPDLLTLRAVRLIEDADIVITEEPGHADLVRVVRARAEVVGDEPAPEVEYVDGGFGEDGQPLTHAARAKVVVKQAKRGLRVVRLLGGTRSSTPRVPRRRRPSPRPASASRSSPASRRWAPSRRTPASR